MAKEKKSLSGKKLIRAFEKKILPNGNSAHIPVNKEYIGEFAEIKIYKDFMICQRCSETFFNKKNFTKGRVYCKLCLDGLEILKKLKKNNKLVCKDCGRRITEKEFKTHWDVPQCTACWTKEAEEFSNKEDTTSTGAKIVPVLDLNIITSEANLENIKSNHDFINLKGVNTNHELINLEGVNIVPKFDFTTPTELRLEGLNTEHDFTIKQKKRRNLNKR